MKFNKLHLAIIFFCYNTYSQEKEISCQIIAEDFQYFQITIFKNNVEPLFINVVGKEINFENFSKESLFIFMNDLYEKNSFVPSFVLDRNFYLQVCNPTNIDLISDFKFISKFNAEIEKLSKKNKKYYNLKTGENILVKGINIRGKFLEFKNENHNFAKISFYPDEIYECPNIVNYIIPLEIELFSKIKKCNKSNVR
jgi:hypothetical protein